MAGGAQRTIDRRAVESISAMELRARAPVEGHYSGIHKSPYHGFNVEFAEFREYAPGDDPRHLDWRVFARSDRYYVKKFEAETNLNCYLLLDCSGSMDFGTGSVTRLDYAASLAAALALLLLRQGDHVALVAFDEKVRHFIPPRGHARHYSVLQDVLTQLRPGSDTDIAAVLHDIAEQVARRSLIVLLSDLFDEVDAVMRGLQHFRHRGHEVIVLHLLDPAELSFPFDRVSMFEGLERDQSLVADPAVIAESYRSRMRSYLEAVKRGCAEKNIDYERMVMTEPFDRSLRTYLGRRKARVAAAAGGAR